MTELQLYKWLQGVEVHLYQGGRERDNLSLFTEINAIDWKVLVMPDFDKLKEFSGLCGYNYFDEYDMEIILKHGYVCFDILPVINNFEIDPKNIFP